jgi:hypothetical protein
MTPGAMRDGRDAWERVTEGWVDNTHDDAFTHTATIVERSARVPAESEEDPARLVGPGDVTVGVEVRVVALPSPTYQIRHAQASALAGTVDPSVLGGCARLAGVPMIGGLGRKIAEAIGDGAGAALVRDAVLEIARLARQVAKLPRAEAERVAAAGAAACWDLDRVGFADLPDSCFTYSAAGRALFGTRTVITPMTADIYSPAPGQARVFVRRKVARIDKVDGRLRLFHSMHDNVHGFELTCEVDPASGRIVRAEHVTPRLPYMGICSEPQRNVARLLGETLDAGLAKRIQAHLGGSAGCAQLYDLTADLLRLVAAVAPGGRA